jgi:hypothetical protein
MPTIIRLPESTAAPRLADFHEYVNQNDDCSRRLAKIGFPKAPTAALSSNSGSGVTILI